MSPVRSKAPRVAAEARPVRDGISNGTRAQRTSNGVKILVSGSVAYDQIMNYPGRFRDAILPEKIHILSVSFLVSQLRKSFGGTAGNISYNLSLLGERPTILANVGNDFASYHAWLRKQTIDQSQLSIDKIEPTASAFIITDQDDNQISAFYPGALGKPYRLNVSMVKPNDLAIIAPDNPENYLNLSKIYKTKKLRYIFDPGQQAAAVSGNELKKVLTGAAVFISNDYELSLILKKTGWNLMKLCSTVPLVITTLGAKGSLMYQAGKKIKVTAAKPKTIVDPTGAGDAYRAGLIKGLLTKWPLAKVGRFAGLVAVYTVEKQGTQTHQFSWKQLTQRYRQNFKERL